LALIDTNISHWLDGIFLFAGRAMAGNRLAPDFFMADKTVRSAADGKERTKRFHLGTASGDGGIRRK